MSDQITWLCWSIDQQKRNPVGDAIAHIQGKKGRTLCGIKIGGYWDFIWIDEAPNEFRGCIRCRRIVTRQSDAEAETVRETPKSYTPDIHTSDE